MTNCPFATLPAAAGSRNSALLVHKDGEGLLRLTNGEADAFIGDKVRANFQFGWQAAGVLVLSWGLLAASLIDADHQLLPDELTLPLLWLGLIVNSFGVFVPLTDAMWAAVAGYLSLWSVFWLFRLLTGQDGLGYGDFKLLALLGAWGGWQILPLTILLAALAGTLGGLTLLRLRNAQVSTPIPFGPYLAMAGWAALIWGDQITNFYWQFVG